MHRLMFIGIEFQRANLGPSVAAEQNWHSQHPMAPWPFTIKQHLSCDHLTSGFGEAGDEIRYRMGRHHFCRVPCAGEMRQERPEAGA